jgi:hypothetical protein
MPVRQRIADGELVAAGETECRAIVRPIRRINPTSEKPTNDDHVGLIVDEYHAAMLAKVRRTSGCPVDLHLTVNKFSHLSRVSQAHCALD